MVQCATAGFGGGGAAGSATPWAGKIGRHVDGAARTSQPAEPSDPVAGLARPHAAARRPCAAAVAGPATAAGFSRDSRGHRTSPSSGSVPATTRGDLFPDRRDHLPVRSPTPRPARPARSSAARRPRPDRRAQASSRSVREVEKIPGGRDRIPALSQADIAFWAYNGPGLYLDEETASTTCAPSAVSMPSWCMFRRAGRQRPSEAIARPGWKSPRVATGRSRLRHAGSTPG